MITGVWLTAIFAAGCCVGLLLMAVLHLARKPKEMRVIRTYAELSTATGIPIERLHALRMFGPLKDPIVIEGLRALGWQSSVPKTQAAAAVEDAATWPGQSAAVGHVQVTRDIG